MNPEHDLHKFTVCLMCDRCIEVDCPCGMWQEAVDGLCGRCLQKDKWAPEGLMYAILATSCPVDVLEDNWMVHRIELCDVTWEIEARCISTPSQDQVENGDLWLFKQEIRSARILKWDAVRNMLV